MPSRHTFLLAALLTACSCQPQPSTPDKATLLKVHAATTRHAARFAYRDLRDTGAESARPTHSRLFGIDDTSARRVFLIDASGSMQRHVGPLRAHLNQALDALDPQSAFALVTFSEDDLSTLAPNWLMATPDAKARAKRLLNALQPNGSSDPTPAFRRISALHPQTVYLLTDGDFPNASALASTLLPFTLHIIALGDPTTSNDPLLRQLADNHHGTFTRLRR